MHLKIKEHVTQLLENVLVHLIIKEMLVNKRHVLLQVEQITVMQLTIREPVT